MSSVVNVSPQSLDKLALHGNLFDAIRQSFTR